MSGAAPLLLCLAAAVAVWPSRAPAVRARLRALAGPGPAPPRPRGSAVAGTRGRWLLAAAAGLAAGALVGGTAGPVVAAVGTVAAERLLRARGGRGEGDAAALRRDLPVACDLLAVCLGTGLPVPGALAAVAAALPGPVGRELGAVAALQRLGAPPRQAWEAVPEELAGLRRAVVRAGESGSAVVPALRALSADVRAGERSRADAAVRRAGVWVLAPLGVCFLPAFLCLGVVPLVIGIAGDVLG
ncbi:type II secretion system F family protein [Geodermatophilus marinus]|uniref:type II secretion system F family protein n=1 Tax=Geodermatophilus sp. LHW52908 TaxID=2303986 RepID=UPI000E3E9A05|nr:type II secretion system F family protein [Geodermatophilus sp. LHW52908]RFU22226.1 type II secretion protein F [Geodermatophilus sp. LHW52908]